MKNLFFYFFISLMFIGCSDNDNPSDVPVANLELPITTVDSPIVAGETVIIKGEGFISTDEIWFYKTATRTNDAVKAENVTITSGGISFTAPSLNGECRVVLMRNAQEYTLGSLVFVHQSKEIRCLATGADDTIYSVNLATGEYTKIGSLTKEVYQFEDLIYISATQTIYGLAYDDGEYDSAIGTYNTADNSFGILVENDEEAICLLERDGELYKLGQDDENELTLYKISKGKSEKVMSFGSLDDITDGYICSAVFDATTTSIIVTYETGSSGGCMKLNLGDSSIKGIDNAYTSDCSLFRINSDLCISSYDDDADVTSIYALNLSDNKRGKLLASFEGEWYEYEYDDQNNRLYCLSDVFDDGGNTLAVYDFSSSQLSVIKKGLPIYEIVLVW